MNEILEKILEALTKLRGDLALHRGIIASLKILSLPDPYTGTDVVVCYVAGGGMQQITPQQIALPSQNAVAYVWVEYLDNTGAVQNTGWQLWTNILQQTNPVEKIIAFDPVTVAATIGVQFNSIIVIKFGYTHGFRLEETKAPEHMNWVGDLYDGEDTVDTLHVLSCDFSSDDLKEVPLTESISSVYVQAVWQEGSQTKRRDWSTWRNVNIDKRTGVVSIDYTPIKLIQSLGIDPTVQNVCVRFGGIRKIVESVTQQRRSIGGNDR